MKRTIVLTGATSGIGLATLITLKNLDCTIILGCRNREKSEKIISDIRRASPQADIHSYHLDLASFASIREFSDAVTAEFPVIDVLFNNAGVFMDRAAKTEDGYEMTIGVNFLGTFYLTTLLLDTLKKGRQPQIINICSRAALFGKLRKHNDVFSRHPHGFRAYSASKYMQLLMTLHMAEILQPEGISCNAVHPGEVATNIWKGDSLLMRIMAPIQKRRLLSPEQGARAGLYLLTDRELRKTTGKFFEREGVEIPLKSSITAPADRERLLHLLKEIL